MICCTFCSYKACRPCEFLCDCAAWPPEWSFCYNGGTWRAFRPCESACACASSSTGWTLCCKTDNETAYPRCEFWCDLEGVKIFQRTSRNACTEIVSAFVSFVPHAMTSARPWKVEVKGQMGRPLDCPWSHSVYWAKERIFPLWARKPCHAVSSALGDARKGDRDTL